MLGVALQTRVAVCTLTFPADANARALTALRKLRLPTSSGERPEPCLKAQKELFAQLFRVDDWRTAFVRENKRRPSFFAAIDHFVIPA